MEYSYDDMKKFDKRVATETKKAKDMAAAMQKAKQQLESERKAYCVDFKKQLMLYADKKNEVHAQRYQALIDDFCMKLEIIDKAYETAIIHIDSVASNALTHLPTQLELHKKAIKGADKNPAGWDKVKDFEWDRIETTKLAMLHFSNAQMFLHAKCFELFAQVYDDLKKLDFEEEFVNADKKDLRKALREFDIIEQHPTGKDMNAARNQGIRRSSPRK